MIPSVFTLPRWLVVAGTLALAGAIGVSVYSYGNAEAWKADADAWEARANASDSLRAQDARVIESVQAGAAAIRTELTDALGMNARLAAEGERLRRERRNVLVVSSVPGQEPSVGDTLRACLLELTLCEKEAAVEKLRADSLADVAQGAQMATTALEARALLMGQRLATLQGLVDDARPIIRNADPPCFLVRAGPLRVHCLGRKDGAALAAAGTLLLTSQFAKSEDAKRFQMYAAGGLVAGSIVIW